jgi:hypothetical protein
MPWKTFSIIRGLWGEISHESYTSHRGHDYIGGFLVAIMKLKDRL